MPENVPSGAASEAEPLPLFDSHAHYDDPAFDADRGALLGSVLPQKGVRGIITAGTNAASCAACRELAEKYGFVWYAAGIHPEDAEKELRGILGLPDADGAEAANAHSAPEPPPVPPELLEQGVRRAVERIAPFLQDEKCVALGEIGLDYHWPIERELQKRLFYAQLALARDLDLPVVIHDREAHADTLEALRRFRPRGTLHCFSGSAEMAKEVLGLGLYLGFTGNITFKGNKKAAAVLAVTPRGRILTETDCPYMAPEPLRGSRCDSSLIRYTLPAVAAAKAATPAEAAHFAEENARRLFGLPDSGR